MKPVVTSLSYAKTHRSMLSQNTTDCHVKSSIVSGHHVVQSPSYSTAVAGPVIHPNRGPWAHARNPRRQQPTLTPLQELGRVPAPPPRADATSAGNGTHTQPQTTRPVADNETNQRLSDAAQRTTASSEAPAIGPSAEAGANAAQPSQQPRQHVEGVSNVAQTGTSTLNGPAAPSKPRMTKYAEIRQWRASHLDNGINWDEVQSRVEDRVWHGIRSTSICWMQNTGLDVNDNATFVQDPTSELEELCSILFGTKEWRRRVIELTNCEDPVKLGSGVIMFGLISAAIQKHVFQHRLPWNIEDNLDQTFGPNITYLQQMAIVTGFDLKNLARHASWRQIVDKEFQQTTVMDHAKKLAHKSIMTLQPHLKQGKIDPYHKNKGLEWIERLENAFKEAIILGHKMDSDIDRTMDFVSFEHGDKFNGEKMESVWPVDHPGEVLVMLFPATRMWHNMQQCEIGSSSRAQCIVRRRQSDPGSS
ncbi:hypothetical protein EJ03DRAFT_179363 [Teratosphaeria nubilosa]|uniref:Uncharacterized protein n=1 Tax=Teratosphaeria nubilosa TaxID=161662 RepID=A0A6G1L0K4_9PEZI|nr:hypothetical protein EJ03DRAFT_179363 [Teratosphaeria nubilosa]